MLAVCCKKADSCRLGSYPLKQDFVVLLRQIGAQRRPPVRQTPPRRHSRICACARMHRHSAAVRRAPPRQGHIALRPLPAFVPCCCAAAVGKSENRKKRAFHCRRRTKRRQLGTLFFRRRPHDNGTASGTLQTAKTRCFPLSKHEKAVCCRTEIMNAFPRYWRTAFADAVGEPTAQQRHDGVVIVSVYAARGERERYKGVEFGVALYIVPDGGAAAPLIGGAALLLRGVPLLPPLRAGEEGHPGRPAPNPPDCKLVGRAREAPRAELLPPGRDRA